LRDDPLTPKNGLNGPPDKVGISIRLDKPMDAHKNTSRLSAAASKSAVLVSTNADSGEKQDIMTTRAVLVISGRQFWVSHIVIWLLIGFCSGQTSTASHSRSSASAETKTDTTWSQFHRPNMTRWNKYENTLNVTNVGNLVLEWSFYVGEGNDVLSGPAMNNGRVVAGSGNGSVYALDAATGAELWDFQTGGAAYSSPAIANGVVYINSVGYENNLFALDAKTGRQLWVYAVPVNYVTYSSPAVVNGVVYVGLGDTNVYALDAKTGTKIWSYTTGGPVSSSPAVANGMVYFCSDQMYALNASTGSLVWSYAFGGSNASPAIANGVVYVASGDGVVYALDAKTGSKVWSYAIGGYVDSSAAVTNEAVYVGSGDTYVYALDIRSGTPFWAYKTGGSVESSPAVANGVVYVTSDDFFLYALHARTGALLWSQSAGYYGNPPTVASGVVYAGSTYDSRINAYGLNK